MVRTLFTTEGHVFFVEGRNGTTTPASSDAGNHDLLVAESSAGTHAPLHSHLVPPPHSSSGGGGHNANRHPHAAVVAAREAASRRGRRSHSRALEEGAREGAGGAGHGERRDTCALPTEGEEEGEEGPLVCVDVG